ncbi:MAG TPA: hypothetical protein DCZ91_23315, partial [Lachnospiraceae bacterium]|nr:hypothetical protein [Lachnospiraceae bacterium]
ILAHITASLLVADCKTSRHILRLPALFDEWIHSGKTPGFRLLLEAVTYMAKGRLLPVSPGAIMKIRFSEVILS